MAVSCSSLISCLPGCCLGILWMTFSWFQSPLLLILSENMHTDRCGNTYREKCHAKESWKEIKYEILCRETQETWKLKCLILPVGISYRNSDRRFKEKFGSLVRRTFARFITKDSCTSNITHITGSAAELHLKPEWWGSPMVQECREEKVCDKRRWWWWW